MKTKRQKCVLVIAALLLFLLAFPQIVESAGLVPCKDDCDLCYLLIGISNIFQWLMEPLLFTTALLGIIIAGMILIFSGLFPKTLAFAKQAFSSSLKGFAIALCCWIIINGVMNAVGWKGGKWYEHECTTSRRTNTGENGKCDPKNKKLESIKIQCDEKDFKLEGDGTGFYVVLDTLSEDKSKETKKLKALAKYNCDGEISEEDITQKAEWKASDETQIKVAKGVVQAVSDSMNSENPPYVEAKFQGKTSNQAKVYINVCPNTEITNSGKKTNSSIAQYFESQIAKAQTQSAKNIASGACESCGQLQTCHFIYGNPDGDFKIYLIRGDNSVTPRYPENITPWSVNNQEKLEKFKKFADRIARGIDSIPERKDNIAVYRSDEIAASDPSCPTGKTLSSYGYVFDGTGRAVATRTSFTAEYYTDTHHPMVLAHEHIGHIIGDLNDEYVDSNILKLAKKWTSPHYNCTGLKSLVLPPAEDPKNTIIGTKWGKFNVSSISPGCFYSSDYYKYCPKGGISIMSDDVIGKDFFKVNECIIEYTMDNFPIGPTEWAEYDLDAGTGVYKSYPCPDFEM